MEVKTLDQITRKEWIKFKWEENPQTFGNEDRTFYTAGLRTPNEAYQAMEEWDITAAERDCEVNPEPQDEKGIV